MLQYVEARILPCRSSKLDLEEDEKVSCAGNVTYPSKNDSMQTLQTNLVQLVRFVYAGHAKSFLSGSQVWQALGACHLPFERNKMAHQ